MLRVRFLFLVIWLTTGKEGRARRENETRARGGQDFPARLRHLCTHANGKASGCWCGTGSRGERRVCFQIGKSELWSLSESRRMSAGKFIYSRKKLKIVTRWWQNMDSANVRGRNVFILPGWPFYYSDWSLFLLTKSHQWFENHREQTASV